MGKILVACEESQVVTKAFRDLGHEAYSCDILPCSGGHPEWHLQEDVLPLLKQDWDLLIAHPPCTYLSHVGNIWFTEKYKSRFPTRPKQREEAKQFFMEFVNSPIKYKAIENPVGIMNSYYRKPNQIISPHQFGASISKRTCFWLFGLPNLEPTLVIKNPKPFQDWGLEQGALSKMTPQERSTFRSKTHPLLAKAMAEQWGKLV